MKKEKNLHRRLCEAINDAILSVGQVEGRNEVVMKNTDVTDALLEVAGFWAAAHSFDGYTSRDLAQKYARTLEDHIDSFRPLLASGALPVNIIPRSKVN